MEEEEIEKLGLQMFNNISVRMAERVEALTSQELVVFLTSEGSAAEIAVLKGIPESLRKLARDRAIMAAMVVVVKNPPQSSQDWKELLVSGLDRLE